LRISHDSFRTKQQHFTFERGALPPRCFEDNLPHKNHGPIGGAIFFICTHGIKYIFKRALRAHKTKVTINNVPWVNSYGTTALLCVRSERLSIKYHENNFYGRWLYKLRGYSSRGRQTKDISYTSWRNQL